MPDRTGGVGRALCHHAGSMELAEAELEYESVKTDRLLRLLLASDHGHILTYAQVEVRVLLDFRLQRSEQDSFESRHIEADS